MVFPHVLNWYAELPGLDIGKLEAYFDRNEQFMRHIEPDWRNKEIRKRHPQWELVKSINQAEMQSTSALQLADVIAWGRNRLESGSHWQTDPHYTTAVRAAGSLQGIHRPCSESALAGFHYREEGYAAIDRQRIKQEQKMANASEEFKKFDRMMRELIHARHDEMKTKSDAQKTKRTKSRKS